LLSGCQWQNKKDIYKEDINKFCIIKSFSILNENFQLKQIKFTGGLKKLEYLIQLVYYLSMKGCTSLLGFNTILHQMVTYIFLIFWVLLFF
jgi:hypothetical protein